MYYLQAIQDVNEFVSSSKQIWRNVALHYLCFPIINMISYLCFRAHRNHGYLKKL